MGRRRRRRSTRPGLIYAANPPTAVERDRSPAGQRALGHARTSATSVAARPDGRRSCSAPGTRRCRCPTSSNQSFGDAAKTAAGAEVQGEARAPDEFSPTVKKGDVIGTDPRPLEAAPYGSTVVVHVSKGPDLVVVPDVTFETSSRPRPTSRRRSAGRDGQATTGPDGVVMSQNPARPAKLPRGSPVDLVLQEAARPRRLSAGGSARCLRSAPLDDKGAEHGCTRRTGRDHHRRGPRSRREHALLFASEGAKVVVNDLGGDIVAPLGSSWRGCTWLVAITHDNKPIREASNGGTRSCRWLAAAYLMDSACCWRVNWPFRTKSLCPRPTRNSPGTGAR